MRRKLSLHTESWPIRTPFRITGATWEHSQVVICEIEQDGEVGRGEGVGVYYRDETPASMSAQIVSATAPIESGATRKDLLKILPHGGARNAVDCALWDLEARRACRSAWEIAGVSEGPVRTVFTVGLEAEPSDMAKKARAAAEYPDLKVKLNHDRPVERIAAIRGARPDARLVIDVNQAWSFEQLKSFAPPMKELGVTMIEQPLPRGYDAALADYKSPVLLCADESCLDLQELDEIAGRYQMINIKLDKCGGLTAALELAAVARSRGMRLMVGNMLGTSLSMAPAHIIGRLSDFADLDGPLLLSHDRPHGMRYEAGQVYPPPSGFWGRGAP
jgi:L-alanine-DL-glutamate epimerase-like enolase superfamily enzyme